MTDKIVRIEPTPMVLFAKIDADPGFIIKLCNEASLFESVKQALYFSPAGLDAEQQVEVQETIDELKQSGNVVWSDGWVELRIGMADVTSFLMQKITEAKEEERYADTERFKMMEERNEARARFKALQVALLDALGEKIVEIAGKAAA